MLRSKGRVTLCLQFDYIEENLEMTASSDRYNLAYPHHRKEMKKTPLYVQQQQKRWCCEWVRQRKRRKTQSSRSTRRSSTEDA